MSGANRTGNVVSSPRFLFEKHISVLVGDENPSAQPGPATAPFPATTVSAPRFNQDNIHLRVQVPGFLGVSDVHPAARFRTSPPTSTRSRANYPPPRPSRKVPRRRRSCPYHEVTSEARSTHPAVETPEHVRGVEGTTVPRSAGAAGRRLVLGLTQSMVVRPTIEEVVEMVWMTSLDWQTPSSNVNNDTPI